MRTALALCALLAIFLLPSCATITGGSSTSAVAVSTDPAGAQVSLDGSPVGTTPCQVSVRSHSLGKLEFRLDGYESQTVQLHESFNPWFLGNLLLGGIIGMVIDLATGSHMWWTDDSIHVVLQPAQNPS